MTDISSDEKRFVPMLKNIDELKYIIMEYGPKVFILHPIDINILNFIISFIIRENDDAKYISEFFRLITRYYSDETIPFSYDDTKKIGQGAYGIVYNYEEDKVIKYIYHTDNLYFIDITVKAHLETLRKWMIEFCTFVVTMSVLMYIDCSLINDEAIRKTCKSNKWQSDYGDKGYSLNYYSFMAKIYKPFIRQKTLNEYIIGYISEKYTDTLENIYRSDEKSFPDAFNLTQQTIEMLEKIFHLNQFCINISHRDIKPNNIMYTADRYKKNKFKIRLIDYGFMCISIKFQDGTFVSCGTIGSENYDKKNLSIVHLCDNKHTDIIQFIFSFLNSINKFKSTIRKESGVSIQNEFFNLITFNNDNIKKDFLSKNENGKDVVNFNLYNYPMYLRNYKLKYDDIQAIFTKSLDILNMIKKIINAKNDKFKIEDIDYGTIELDDIRSIASVMRESYLYNKEKYKNLNVLKWTIKERL